MNKQLDALEKRRADINRKIQRLKTQEAKKNRQGETRKKILIGSAIVAKIKSGEWPENRMIEMMDKYLTKERDRVLFGLEKKEIIEDGDL